MEQSNKQQSSATKIAIAIGVVALVAVLGTLAQQWLLGKTNVAITSAVDDKHLRIASRRFENSSHD